MVSLFFLCFKGDTPSTDPSIKKSFGLIVVPTGNGKTPLVKKECNRFPRGVPYYNVCEPEMFTKELAEEIGMRVGPSNILDLVLGHFSSDHFLCYHLPGKQKKAINTIFKTLVNVAEKFKLKYGTTPTLLFHCTDVLEKFKYTLFNMQRNQLMEGCLYTIVFVSSEGSIMPLVQKLSTFSQLVKLFEVADIEDYKATDYLEFLNSLVKMLSPTQVEWLYYAAWDVQNTVS